MAAKCAVACTCPCMRAPPPTHTKATHTGTKTHMREEDRNYPPHLEGHVAAEEDIPAGSTAGGGGQSY